MQNFNTYTPRNNPRLIVTVHADTTASVKGCYIDGNDNVSSYTRTHKTEAQALAQLHDMRGRGCEFSIQVNRKA